MRATVVKHPLPGGLCPGQVRTSQVFQVNIGVEKKTKKLWLLVGDDGDDPAAGCEARIHSRAASVQGRSELLR